MGIHFGRSALRRSIGGSNGKIRPPPPPPPSKFDPKLPVLIIGAGTAGLTLATSLHEANIPYQVYERDFICKKNAIPKEINVRCGKDVECFQMRCGTVDVVEVTFTDGLKVVGSMLVGADGGYSMTRLLLLGDDETVNALSGWHIYNGRITLIGDAAHPVPMEGCEGSIHAVRDAKMLARCLASVWAGLDVPPTLEEAVQCYESEMRERTMLPVIMHTPGARERFEGMKPLDQGMNRQDSQDSGIFMDEDV